MLSQARAPDMALEQNVSSKGWEITTLLLKYCDKYILYCHKSFEYIITQVAQWSRRRLAKREVGSSNLRVCTLYFCLNQIEHTIFFMINRK